MDETCTSVNGVGIYRETNFTFTTNYRHALSTSLWLLEKGMSPSRRENVNVVKAYDKYKKAKFKNADGFEIFSVSLDSKIDSWKAAIAKDGLKWEYHVSDLKKWQNEAAAMYGVSSIPMSFLIDENGIIVAKDLRGFDLHLNIDKHVKSLR